MHTTEHPELVQHAVHMLACQCTELLAGPLRVGDTGLYSFCSWLTQCPPCFKRRKGERIAACIIYQRSSNLLRFDIANRDILAALEFDVNGIDYDRVRSYDSPVTHSCALLMCFPLGLIPCHGDLHLAFSSQLQRLFSGFRF
uniref:Uncharacterized protein n=1 Tax=Opuntia streptacantha TaxID=393608 RepID=A0A7C9A746_OPUST